MTRELDWGQLYASLPDAVVLERTKTPVVRLGYGLWALIDSVMGRLIAYSFHWDNFGVPPERVGADPEDTRTLAHSIRRAGWDQIEGFGELDFSAPCTVRLTREQWRMIATEFGHEAHEIQTNPEYMDTINDSRYHPICVGIQNLANSALN